MMHRLRLVLLAFLVATGGAWYMHSAAPWASSSSAQVLPACSPRAGSGTPVGFLGDSITQDAAGGRTPAGIAALALAGRGVRISVINRGVPGSATADWLPGRRMFQRAAIAFHRAHVGIVHVMLGTNDARYIHDVSAARYGRNLAAILRALHRAGCRIVVSYPPFASAHRVNRSLLKSYEQEIDRLVASGAALPGDTSAYRWFAAHPQLRDGVHPNAAGVRALGLLWADALYPLLLDHTRKPA